MNQLANLNLVLPVKNSKVEFALQEIYASSIKATNALIEVALTVKKYELTEEWSAIKERLKTDNILMDWQHKFVMCIVQNPVLLDQKFNKSLPMYTNNLYHLSRIKPETLRELIKTKEINSETTLMECRGFAAEYSDKTKTSSSKSKSIVEKITITIHLSNSRGKKKIAEDAVNTLQKKYKDYEISFKI